MELKTFLDNFEHMAEAPNGVQKLREMILQLAVQGKIVPQHKNEGSSLDIIEPTHKLKINQKKLQNCKSNILNLVNVF